MKNVVRPKEDEARSGDDARKSRGRPVASLLRAGASWFGASARRSARPGGDRRSRDASASSRGPTAEGRRERAAPGAPLRRERRATNVRDAAPRGMRGTTTPTTRPRGSLGAPRAPGESAGLGARARARTRRDAPGRRRRARGRIGPGERAGPQRGRGRPVASVEKGTREGFAAIAARGARGAARAAHLLSARAAPGAAYAAEAARADMAELWFVGSSGGPSWARAWCARESPSAAALSSRDEDGGSQRYACGKNRARDCDASGGRPTVKNIRYRSQQRVERCDFFGIAAKVKTV